MKRITCWNDLRPFGFDCLTGEACGLMYRILFDVTEAGRKILGKCFGISKITLGDAWNFGSKDDPHVESIMLSQEMLMPIGVFALLESGCKEVWILGDGLVGIEAQDTEAEIQRAEHFYGEKLRRKFGYRGTAGDRNIHQMSGRVE